MSLGISRGKKLECRVVAIDSRDWMRLNAAWQAYKDIVDEINSKYELPEVPPVQPLLRFVPA